jgi:3-mercaptopyruvate sulfurtransferase SseA
VRYLDGGVEAWKKAGFPLAAETSPENPAHA